MENKIEKVNLSTNYAIPHIILFAEGLKNPIQMMIDTGAESNLIKQKAVKRNVKINKFECPKLKGNKLTACIHTWPNNDQYFRLLGHPQYNT